MLSLRLYDYALAVSICCFVLTAATQRTDPSEVTALVQIKKSLIDPMDHLRNWNKGDPCTSNWTGIWCLDRVGADGYLHIRELYLMTMNFSGSLAPQLGQLSHLKIMNFMWNNLTGTIPKEIGNITSLELLLLNGNKLSGTLPDELGNLSNLNRLQVDQNQLSGPIPKSFANLINVKHLHLNNNSFSGQIPPELSKLSNLLHFQLDNNNFSGTGIPSTYANLSWLAKLSLENNLLSGTIPVSIWLNMSFSETAKLTVDLRNNSFSDILGNLNPPENITLRLAGNPVCKNSNVQNIGQYCGPVEQDADDNSTNSKDVCNRQSCPLDGSYEYVPASPVPCFCAAPLRIGYRLKSPSFSYFPPYITPFELYVTQSLNLELYQLSIDSYAWEDGPRLRMYLKIFPLNSSVFNTSEVQRIIGIFSSWEFPRTDFFGPYELMNVTLLGPYKNIIIESEKRKTSRAVLVAAIIAAITGVIAISAIVTLIIGRRHIKYRYKLSRNPSNISIKIDGVKAFTFKELSLATDNFSGTTKVGQGGYGKVYKGILSDETIVAIKRVDEGSLQGQKEFLTEIELLSRLHHRNLVSLIGYCDEEGEQILVYEFMPNGSLREWISDGEGTVPKYVSTVVRGTPGYLDPEYFLTHKLTDKSDVYSLGIVFLELLTGMQPISHGKNIVREVNVARQSGLISSIIDSRMGSYPWDCVDKFLSLALSCCHDNQEQRPCMVDVVRELEMILAMLPQSEITFSDTTTSDYSGKLASPSTSASYVAREDQHVSSTVLSGSNLVSDVIPTIVPR
ncbi:putative LRR receptor-like serine/threonine-protein kinase [Senna tora]|uniref:non-specific serine/threonine protein kinase n=1 Tax=Senna tora TaxID=362788 RepID=A0A834WJF6_9FABA|nr:putative LRR receptor-like serine/threonine-protein kinase [Senna tora]